MTLREGGKEQEGVKKGKKKRERGEVKGKRG